jgi:4-hydroxybenzoate polyprenyltransferase
VRGATSYNDIRIMILLNIMTLVFLNIGKGMVTDAFMVMLIYMILSWQWYLFEPIIAPNIFLVLLTHQPWLPLNQIYIYAVFATTQQVSLEWYKVLGAIVLFWLPGGMLLEIGRKIRAPEQEDTYLSYTKRWGLRPALTFLLGINIATSGAWFLFSLWMGLSVLFASLFPVLSMIFTMVVLAFLKNPRKSNNHINLMCQVYVGIVLVFPLLAYLVK